MGGSTLVYIHVLYCHKRFNQYSAHKKDVAIFFSLNSQTYKPNQEGNKLQGIVTGLSHAPTSHEVLHELGDSPAVTILFCVRVVVSGH